MANAYESKLAGGSAATGNATVADVLATKTFSSADGVGLVGTMVNNGAISQTIGAGESYTIPVGYHNGSGVVSAKTIAPIESNENGSGSLTSTFTFNGVSAVPTDYILEAQVYRSSDNATQHAPYINAPTLMPLTGSTTNTPPDHIACTNGAITNVSMSLSGDVLSVTATSNGTWNIKSGQKAYLTILN